MSERTEIAWADSTWNPIMGCTKVSPGCDNCYWENTTPSRVLGFGHGDDKPRRIAADATFNAPLRWAKKPFICDECGSAEIRTVRNWACCDDCGEPAKANVCVCGSRKFHRRRVFLGSMMDFLDPQVGPGTRLRALHIIWRCQEIDFLIVTKRPEKFLMLLLDCIEVITDGSGSNAEFWQWLVDWAGGKPPCNVWMLASVEDQQRADERIRHLLKIPALVHGLSLEPLLGPIQFPVCNGHHDCPLGDSDGHSEKPFGGIDWVIVGGESGRNARPCNVEWIRDIVRQCQAASVPVFVKQLGSDPYQPLAGYDPEFGTTRKPMPMRTKHPKGGNPAEWPEDLRIQQFPEQH